MKLNIRVILGACALALVFPLTASAHPSIFEIVGKVARSPEIQTITITGADGGTFKPSAGATPVAWNAPAYAVQAALGADSAIGRNAQGQAHVLVTGDPGGPYTLRFQGTRATTNEPQVVPDGTGLTGPDPEVVAGTTVQGGQDDVVYENDPDGDDLLDDIVRAVITNDGAVASLVETNGLEASGWLNLRFMPGGYRRPAGGVAMTQEQWVTWPMAQTGFQSHATCQDVAELNTVANVLAVQSNANDPFWNYVPWQKTSAGLGDEPEQWLHVVEEAVDVDLAELDTVADFREACEGLGGVYVPADNPTNPAQGAINEAVEAAVAPLEALIDQLTTGRPVQVTLQAKKNKGKVVVMVTGPRAGQATIRLRVTNALAKKLKIKPVLATSTKKLGAQGATLVTLTPNAATRKALVKRKGAIAITVEAVSGAKKATKKGTLSR